MASSNKSKIGIGILLLLIIIQFFQVDKTNPPIDKNKDFMTIATPPAAIATTLKNACYDCHSHETTYPWYMNISPVSWWIKGHINGGREHLNFSTWGDYSESKAKHKLEECYEMVEKGAMPFTSYVVMHPKAKMTSAEKTTFINWCKEMSEK